MKCYQYRYQFEMGDAYMRWKYLYESRVFIILLFIFNFANSTQVFAQTEDLSYVTSPKVQFLNGTTIDSAQTSIRFISTIESLDYVEAGFVISLNNSNPVIGVNGSVTRTTKTVYKSIKAGADLIPAEILGGKYILALSLNNIPNDSFSRDIYVRPYVKLMDGAISYGVTRTFTVEDYLTRPIDLTAYNAAIAAVEEDRYTIDSWNNYQTLVNANMVTTSNSQSEVDHATAEIINAQSFLKIAVSNISVMAPNIIEGNITFRTTTFDVNANTLVEIKKILVNPGIILQNEKQQLVANVFPEDSGNTSVTWALSPAFATIDSNGILTANNINTGLITIKATANDGSGISASKEYLIGEPLTIDAYGYSILNGTYAQNPDIVIPKFSQGSTWDYNFGYIRPYSYLGYFRISSRLERYEIGIVTRISAHSFDADRTYALQKVKLNSVTIPDSITYIGDYAFRNNRLTNIEIPNSTTYIGTNAFEGNQLTSINIPTSVTYLGSNALSNNLITNITIGEGVEIGDTLLDLNNNFRDTYQIGGEGSYAKSVDGSWTKTSY